MSSQPDTAAESHDDSRMLAIRQILSERLFVPLDEVLPHSRLIADLQADSLDFVDLQFVLEKRFEIHFGYGEFFDATPDWVTKDGFLQPQAVERLTGLLPVLADFSAQGPVPLKVFFDHLTVDTVARIVKRQQAKTAI